MTEKYADRRHLDTTDHAKFIDENADYLRRCRAERITEKLRKIDDALDVVSPQEAQDLRDRRQSLTEELERLGEDADRRAR
jgi:hypothetical protein